MEAASKAERQKSAGQARAGVAPGSKHPDSEKDEQIDDPVSEAINHPIGHVAQALLNIWFKRKPNDNDWLPADIEPFFTQMCDVEVGRFRHGRVLLASRLIALFRVDRSWTEKHLLPLFDWEAQPESRPRRPGKVFSGPPGCIVRS